MANEPHTLCPLLGRDCEGLRCKWFIQVHGTHPNSGESVSRWDCAMAWLPALLIEGAQQTRQTGAAIESFRNEMVRQAEESRLAAVGVLTARLATTPAPKLIEAAE